VPTDIDDHSPGFVLGLGIGDKAASGGLGVEAGFVLCGFGMGEDWAPGALLSGGGFRGQGRG